MKFWGIYKVTNKVNGFSYIGTLLKFWLDGDSI